MYPTHMSVDLNASTTERGFSKVWTYTYFFPTTDPEHNIHSFADFRIKNQDELKRAVAQLEVCPTSGRWHIQGFVRWKRGCRVPQCKLWIGLGDSVHLEIARGTDSENYDYCTKLDSRVDVPATVEGDWKTSGEKRRGVYEKYAKLVAKQGLKAVYVEDPGFVLQNGKKLKEFEEGYVQRFKFDQVQRHVKCIFCSGPTGAGKTSGVRRAFGTDVFELVPHSTKEEAWWDGYEGESVVLIDEIKPQQLDVTSLNRWIDGWPTRVRTKGGHTYGGWKLIILISNYSFYECFTDPHDALKRRVTAFNHLPQPPVYDKYWLMETLTLPTFDDIRPIEVCEQEKQDFLCHQTPKPTVASVIENLVKTQQNLDSFRTTDYDD